MAARVMLLLAAVLLPQSPQAAALPDPTALPPSVASPQDGAAPQASSLAWVRLNGRHSVAWYGGTTVKLGDPVDDGRVVAIREDHIVISGKGGRRTVHLFDQSVCTQARARCPAAR